MTRLLEMLIAGGATRKDTGEVHPLIN
jgi:hypothetical protein